MENNFNIKDLFDLKGIMKLFNTTDIKDVVALEKKLINFLTQEQLEEIAKYEKEILNDLVNSKNSLEELREKYGSLVNKLSSIGIDVNAILNPPHNEELRDEQYEDISLTYDELGISVEDNIDDIIDEHIKEYLDNNFEYESFSYDVDEDEQVVNIRIAY